jgi:hypothetical protein
VFAFDENNVLKTSVKLSDYGLAAGSYNCSHITVASEDRPIRYMPPEALQKARFSEESKERIMAHVCGGGRLQLVGNSQLVTECPDALLGLINSCWCALAKERLTFSELVTALGSIRPLLQQLTPHPAEALLAEERLEREKLARDKTNLEVELARVKLEKQHEEEKAAKFAQRLVEENEAAALLEREAMLRLEANLSLDSKIAGNLHSDQQHQHQQDQHHSGRKEDESEGEGEGVAR